MSNYNITCIPYIILISPFCHSFQEDSTFSLHLERNYKWTASTSGEKEAFIACLWRQTQKFPIYSGTGFTNVDKERLKGG